MSRSIRRTPPPRPRTNVPARPFDREIVLRALDAMTAEDRLVLALQMVDGLADEETAEALGLTVRAVRSRRERLRLALRRALAGLPFGARPQPAPAAVRSAA
jgi:DNA-directed RNA polymerase specialized sigma24 family protein